MASNLFSQRMTRTRLKDRISSTGEVSLVRAGGTGPIRVLVANHSEIESELLVQAIAKDRRFVAVGWSVHQAEIYSLAENTHPDVLLITPRLDDDPSAGLEILREFRICFPVLKIVVLLESHHKDVVLQSLRLGARGVFSKDRPVRMLTKCIVRVHEGQIWATNEQFGLVVDALSARGGRSRRNKISKFSPRELQIVDSLEQGLPTNSWHSAGGGFSRS